MNNYVFANRIRDILAGHTDNMTPVERSRVIAVIIGRALSVQLQLPSSAVVSVDAHYCSNHELTVNDVLSAINESVIIDTRLIAETTFRFYKFRYDLCYGSPEFLADLTYLAPLIPGLLPSEIAAQSLVLTEKATRALEYLIWTFKSHLHPEISTAVSHGITSPLPIGAGV
jgi:hypothetical protein